MATQLYSSFHREIRILKMYLLEIREGENDYNKKIEILHFFSNIFDDVHKTLMEC